MEYRKKPIIVHAITFDDLAVIHAHALTLADAIKSRPWNFMYNDHIITHESADCYIIPTREGIMQMGRDDMLITGVMGEIYPCKIDIFNATYEIVEAVAKNEFRPCQFCGMPDPQCYEENSGQLDALRCEMRRKHNDVLEDPRNEPR